MWLQETNVNIKVAILRSVFSRKISKTQLVISACFLSFYYKFKSKFNPFCADTPKSLIFFNTAKDWKVLNEMVFGS